MTPSDRSFLAPLGTIQHDEWDSVRCTFRPHDDPKDRCIDLAVVTLNEWDRLCERHEVIARRTAKNRDQRYTGSFHIAHHDRYVAFNAVAVIRASRRLTQPFVDAGLGEWVGR